MLNETSEDAQRNQMQKRSTGNDNNATKRNAGRGVRFQSQRRSVCTTKDKARTASSAATKSQSVSPNKKDQRRGRQQRAYPPRSRYTNHSSSATTKSPRVAARENKEVEAESNKEQADSSQRLAPQTAAKKETKDKKEKNIIIEEEGTQYCSDNDGVEEEREQGGNKYNKTPGQHSLRSGPGHG